MNKKRNNKLFNYLVNEYGLSKELVIEQSLSRIEEMFKKHMVPMIKQKLENPHFTNNLVYAIADIMVNGRATYSRTPFEVLLKDYVREAVKAELNDNFNVKLDIARKEEKKEEIK